jgi:hypothetical protein
MRETEGENALERPSPRLLVSARAAAKESKGEGRSEEGAELARMRVEEMGKELRRIALVTDGGESRRGRERGWSR